MRAKQLMVTNSQEARLYLAWASNSAQNISGVSSSSSINAS